MACIFGHKWDGCKCSRCGKTRDKGHDFQLEKGKCSERCSICGKTHVLEHQWNGCKCVRCGTTRDEGHDFQPIEGKCSERCSICGKTHPLEHQWVGCKCVRCGTVRNIRHNFQREENKCFERCSICGQIRPLGHQWNGCKCQICGEVRDEKHDFQPIEGKCSEKCSICGKTRSLVHQWNGFKCERCGATRDEAQIRRDELQNRQDIARVSALRELGLKTHSSLEIDKCARELNSIAQRGGSAGHRANLALRDIVLGNQYTGWDTPKIAGYITEQEIASDPAILRMLETVEGFSSKFDDAMTAQDSGIGRSV
mgnify:CR=1 FL=1